MVLKFLAAGLISALLAAGVMYFLIDEDMAAGLRASPPTQVAGETVTADPSLIDRALGRDDTPESRVGRPVEEPSEDYRKGWLEDYLPRKDNSVPIEGAGADPAMFGTLIEQASRIEIVDARDDAYFNILIFALSENRHTVAGEVLEKLSTPELRDTARQRVGISHAQAGRMEDAFAVIDTIEIEELKDPIRLEIIRSATSITTPG